MIKGPVEGALENPERFRELVMERCAPVVLRGAARHWPMLARGDLQAVVDHLLRFEAGRTAEVFVGAPEMGARYHYDEALTGFAAVDGG